MLDALNLPQTVQFIRDAGSTGLLVVAILGGFKGWYVWRWQYDESKVTSAAEIVRLERERDEWKAIALRGLSVAERVTG